MFFLITLTVTVQKKKWSRPTSIHQCYAIGSLAGPLPSFHTLCFYSRPTSLTSRHIGQNVNRLFPLLPHCGILSINQCSNRKHSHSIAGYIYYLVSLAGRFSFRIPINHEPKGQLVCCMWNCWPVCSSLCQMAIQRSITPFLFIRTQFVRTSGWDFPKNQGHLRDIAQPQIWEKTPRYDFDTAFQVILST